MLVESRFVEAELVCQDLFIADGMNWNLIGMRSCLLLGHAGSTKKLSLGSRRFPIWVWLAAKIQAPSQSVRNRIRIGARFPIAAKFLVLGVHRADRHDVRGSLAGGAVYAAMEIRIYDED